MQDIYRWTAKRAGGRITITGADADGNVVKVVGVDTIVSADAISKVPVATDKDGNQYRLC